MTAEMFDTPKQKVRQNFPKAISEQEKINEWSVWDMPRSMTHGIRWPGDVALARKLLGLGNSENDAWLNALQINERHVNG